MSFLDILLIIISSAGLLHGVLIAFYLCFFKKKKTMPNLFLGLILLCMALRIGKSVFLNFGSDLEPIFIFIGLAFLLLIGPLLRWYVYAMTHPDFKIKISYFLELIPFIIVFGISFFIPKNWLHTDNKQAIIVFGSTLICIYLHLAFYIVISGLLLKKVEKRHKNTPGTKFQKSIFEWLYILIAGFSIIWVSYFLNILEDTIPYIIGPIMYSIVIYFLSYRAFELNVMHIDGDVFKENNDSVLFNKIYQLVVGEKQYLESDISLSTLSKLIGKSTQKTSEVINQYAKQNYNDFVNYYRIQEAKRILLDENSRDSTISTVAFDCGFSSLSSFNSAFKKFENMTPSSFRKEFTI